MNRPSILLIISGSIAAYKSLDLIRRLRERDIEVRCILTKGGAEFITPLSVASLCGQPVYSDLFSLKDEVEMGHIRLSREADLVVVAPASADLIAKMAAGNADDLATAALLASDKRILVAPAMNAQMWKHPATQRNIKQIVADGAILIEPGEGMLACGEIGAGRMAEMEVILEAIFSSLRAQRSNPDSGSPRPLRGLAMTALVTSGPTHEPIDPVRYIGNYSSGRQGHAIAEAMAQAGVQVTLVTGPTALVDPAGVNTVHVNSAQEMLTICEAALPVDVAICAAAVGDWKVEQPAARKLKKRANAAAPVLQLVENVDILKAIAGRSKQRPKLVIGFAAETENIIKNAIEKRKRKGCDWIVANDVSGGKTFGAEDNEVTLITAQGEEHWPCMAKEAVAEKLVENILTQLQRKKT